MGRLRSIDLNYLATRKSRITIKSIRVEILLFCFWYVSSFPGKLGFDSSELLRLIQNDRQTAWWGSSFYWFVYFTSFKGEQIFVTSFISLVVYTIALLFLIKQLPVNPIIRRRALRIFMMTPLYGTFGVTVSHDVFLVSGIMLIFGELLRHNCRVEPHKNKGFWILIMASSLLMTNQAGILIALTSCAVLYFRKPPGLFLLILTISSLYFISNQTIKESFSQDQVTGSINRIMIADIKCVVQHPTISEHVITAWGLTRYASLEKWKKPVNCASIDLAIASLEPLNNHQGWNKSLLKTYLNVAAEAPAVVLMSHIQRSRNALPPLLFPAPDNQVNLNASIPLGIASNLALQDGPELLHPSVDLTSVDINNRLTKFLEIPSQTLTFLVNQASWFWGWGGFWILFIFAFLILHFPLIEKSKVVLMTTPFITQHLVIFVVGAGSLGRYVMCSISVGFLLFLIILMEKLEELRFVNE